MSPPISPPPETRVSTISFRDQITELKNRITALTHRQSQLKASVAQWQDAFDALGHAIAILDSDHCIIECNRAMTRLFNLPKQQILGHTCWQILSESDLPQEPSLQAPVLKDEPGSTRRTCTLSYRGRWFEASMEPRFDQQGNITGYLQILSDVTQAVTKEMPRQDAHTPLLTVLDSIDAIIYAADIETDDILFMNHYTREMFKNEALIQPCWRIFYNRDEPCQHCNGRQLFDEHGNPKDTVIWEEQHPKIKRWYLHKNRAVKWTDGRYVRLHTATDISAIKMLEQERIQNEVRLRQAQKMEAIGTLAGGIAHDFNNILSAILGYSDMALDDAQKGIPTPTYIRQIFTAGQRARELVQQILTFSRQTETEARPIQVQHIIKEALKLLRASLPSTIQINTAINSDAYIKADPVQIHQVFMNLCTNASYAMRESGGVLKVHISNENLTAKTGIGEDAIQPGTYLKIEISDTGEGISAELLDKIFDPYFSTKPRGEGTGMGLAVVQGIVRNYKGCLSVQSAVGKGTQFTIYLPVMPLETNTESLPAHQVLRGHEHILFVDDEPPLTELGKELLERLGYRVTVCNDSPYALTLFEQNADEFDLVITDMTMPTMTGEKLAEKMLAVRPDIPIMICTGYSHKVTKEMIQRLGIRALIMKPLIRNELAYMIRNVLDRK